MWFRNHASVLGKHAVSIFSPETTRQQCPRQNQHKEIICFNKTQSLSGSSNIPTKHYPQLFNIFTFTTILSILILPSHLHLDFSGSLFLMRFSYHMRVLMSRYRTLTLTPWSWFQVRVTLRLTASQSACLGVEPFRDSWPDFSVCWRLRSLLSSDALSDEKSFLLRVSSLVFVRIPEYLQIYINVL